MDNYIEEKRLHEAFEISIILKGIHAIIEIIGGIGAFFVTKTFLVSTALSFTQEELNQDPHDAFSHYLINLSNTFSISTSHFVALYLLSHGVIKLAVIVGLFKKKMWAYPASLVVFMFFIIYQLHRYMSTHSVWLLIFTFFDMIVIALTIHEWSRRKKGL